MINHQFCAFKLKTSKEQNFCRNEYNVSGLCNRQSCPLANAKYATVRNVDGRLYLYMKTAERAHTPRKLWERVKLSQNYARALQQIDEHLIYWPNFLIHKCKQRMTRLVQVAMKERKLASKYEERHYAHTAPKVKRREENRERKALAAAKLEKNIEKELLDRLKSGAYGEQPLNVDEQIWKRVLKGMKKEHELEGDELDEEEEEEEDEEEEEGEVEYVEGDEHDDDELVELEDLEKWLGKDDDDQSSDDSDSDDSDSDAEPSSKKRPAGRQPAKKRPKVEIEYENENEKINLPQVSF